MTRNHLTGDIASIGLARFGEYAWSGNGSTAFWIDPSEDMTVLLMTQLMPSASYSFRRELRVAAYQAIID